MKSLGFFIFLTVFFYLTPAVAQKNDTLYLVNGDRLTGELKKLEYGLVSLSTQAMQTVKVEYDKISTIYSTKYFELRVTSGERYFGSIAASRTLGSVTIITANDSITEPLSNIVQISSIKNKLVQRLDGSIGLGLNYTKASDVFQYNVDAQVTHRTNNYATRFDLSSIVTDQNTDGITRNSDIGLNVTRFLPDKWFVRVQVKGQQNTELDLAYRFQSGLAGGYDIVRTNSQRFYGLVGVLFNREKTIETAYISYNLEGLVSLQYKWIKYNHPKIDVTSGINYFPSFTVTGRNRLELNLNAKFEIVTDLFFGLNFYDTYDSKNPSDGKANHDYGVVSSISYSF